METAKHIKELSAVLNGLDALADKINILTQKIAQTYKNGGKLVVMGNGGSCSDALHLCAEFTGRYKLKRKGLPAIALCENPSAMTSISNDFSFDEVFARQVEAFAKPGDLALGISTSGNSVNVLHGLAKAKELKCFTAALLGGDGGKIAKTADLSIIAPSANTPRIQECHILICHIICEEAEKLLFA